MKKWIIIIGLVVLAVSAIAAIKISNKYILLDEFSSLNYIVSNNYGKSVFYTNGSDTSGVRHTALVIYNGTIPQTMLSIVSNSDDIYSNFVSTVTLGTLGIFFDIGNHYFDLTLEGNTNDDDIVIDTDEGATQRWYYNGTIQFPLLTSTGNQYACLDATGKLFGSDTPCVG